MNPPHGKMSKEQLLRMLNQRDSNMPSNGFKASSSSNHNHGNQYHNNFRFDQQDQSGLEPSDLDGTNLYIKGLWKDCTQVELDDLFKKFGVISQSRVYGDGVGFVRFEQAHEAKRAIGAMHGKKLDRCPDQLLVKYAFKKQRRDKRYIRVGDEVKQYEVEMIMNKNTNNVYLRGFPRGYTEQMLTALCEPYGELTCTRLRESGVAFVRYRKPEDAQNAIRQLNGKRFDNHNETLLAKYANSDPFQPKIGFKQHRQFEDDDDLSQQQQQQENGQHLVDGNNQQNGSGVHGVNASNEHQDRSYTQPPRRQHLHAQHHGVSVNQHQQHLNPHQNVTSHRNHQYAPNPHGSANGTPNHGRSRNLNNHPLRNHNNLNAVSHSALSQNHGHQGIPGVNVQGQMYVANNTAQGNTEHSVPRYSVPVPVGVAVNNSVAVHNGNGAMNGVNVQVNPQLVTPNSQRTAQAQVQSVQVTGVPSQPMVSAQNGQVHGHLNTGGGQASYGSHEVPTFYAQDMYNNHAQNYAGHSQLQQYAPYTPSTVGGAPTYNQVNHVNGTATMQYDASYGATNPAAGVQYATPSGPLPLQGQPQGQPQTATSMVQVYPSYYYYPTTQSYANPQTPAQTPNVVGTIQNLTSPNPSGSAVTPNQVVANTIATATAVTAATASAAAQSNNNGNGGTSDQTTTPKTTAPTNGGGGGGSAAAQIAMSGDGTTKTDKVEAQKAVIVTTPGGAATNGQLSQMNMSYLYMLPQQGMSGMPLARQVSPPPGSVGGFCPSDISQQIDALKCPSDISSYFGHVASEIIAKQTQLVTGIGSKMAMPAQVVIPKPSVRGQVDLNQLSPGVAQLHPGHSLLQGYPPMAMSATMTPTPNPFLAQHPTVVAAGVAPAASSNPVVNEGSNAINGSIANMAEQLKQLQIVNEAASQSAGGGATTSSIPNRNGVGVQSQSGLLSQQTSQSSSPLSAANASSKATSGVTSNGNCNPKSFDSLKVPNPHSVSKLVSNELYAAISHWYPNRAGKLTGMFLQTHNEEKVKKYLTRRSRLRHKMDQFVQLLETTEAPNGTVAVQN